MPESLSYLDELPTADDTAAAGRRLAEAILETGIDRVIIHLCGDLGAGKTTFARGFLDGFGHRGRVPSPTYTLVEPYEFGRFNVYHIDLYRLADPSEVDDLGLVDLDGSGVIMLIEWPERGADRILAADVRLTFEVRDSGRGLRREALTEGGRRVLDHKNG